jgi:hypothetical protein
VTFTWGTEQRLIERLERRELHLVAAGLDHKTPWQKQVGLTQAYFESERTEGEHERRVEHVLAVPPGENAWLRELELFLHREQAAVAELYAQAE